MVAEAGVSPHSGRGIAALAPPLARLAAPMEFFELDLEAPHFRSLIVLSSGEQFFNVGH